MSVQPIAKGFKEGFTDFGHSISTLVNSILLSVVYWVGIGPTSLVAKVMGKRFLVMDGEDESYWTDVDIGSSDKEIDNYYRQF